MAMRKKGIYYSIDAMLAGILITGALALIIVNPFYDSSYTSKNYLSEDLLIALSSIKLSDVEDSMPSHLISSIDDFEISVLEQIGKYWALDYPSRAEDLAVFALSSLNVSDKEIKLKMGGELIHSFGEGKLRDVSVARRMIAGIERGRPLAGTSASAYLRRIRDKKTSSYHYFGGFIGQGNVSFFIKDLPQDINRSGISRVDNIYLEGDFQSDFLLYINGQLCGNSLINETFKQSGSLVVDSWYLPHCANLILPGRNNFSISFLGDLTTSSVSGGLLRIDYRTDELQKPFEYGESSYNFHGVDGIANIYDSFFVPGDLEEMSIFLNFNTSQSAYITIGERILMMNTGGEDDILNDVSYEQVGDNFKVEISNNFLLEEANFDYDQLSQNTVPLRFAAYESFSEEFEGGNADVVVITDFSGSMFNSVSSWDSQGTGISRCDELYEYSDARKSHLARCLANELVDTVLDYAGNRIWPVVYHRNRITSYNNPEDKVAIMDHISKYGPQGQGEACISCALNEAYDLLEANDKKNRSTFIVLMSDGSPTHCPQGGCSSILTRYGQEICAGYCNDGGSCDVDNKIGCFLDDERCLQAEDSVRFSANRLIEKFNATVFTIGFGLMDECERAGLLLEEIADMGNGTYQHSSDVDELRLIYDNISYEILTRVDQVNQSVTIQGDLAPSSIYDDSRIDFKYNPLEKQPDPGKISMVFEEDLSNDSCTSHVNIYPGLDVVEAEITSYSGAHWTDTVIVNGVTAFNLSDYYAPYFRLGDPFSVRIPEGLLNEGLNTITVETGDSPENRTGCSEHNKFVYTALLPAVTDRTDSLEFADGCSWTVDTITGSVLDIPIPEYYEGGKNCVYNSSFDFGDFNSRDAYDFAMLSLLDQLDPLNEGEIIVDLDASDLEIRLTTVGSIPYMWGPSIAEVEVVS